MSNLAVPGHHSQALLGGLMHESVQNANLQAQQQSINGSGGSAAQQGPQGAGGGPQLSDADARLATDLLVVQHAPSQAAKEHGMRMAVKDSISQLSPQAQALYTVSLVHAAQGAHDVPSVKALDGAVSQLSRAQKAPPSQLTMGFLNVLYKGALQAGAADAARMQTNIAGAGSSSAGAAAASMPMMESPTAASIPVAGMNAVNAQQAQANQQKDQQQQ